MAAGQLLIAWDALRGPTPEYVLVADADSPDTVDVLAALRGSFLPRKVVAARDGTSGESAALDPIFAGKTSGPQPMLYVCEQFTCRQPLVGVRDIVAELERQRAAGGT